MQRYRAVWASGSVPYLRAAITGNLVYIPANEGCCFAVLLRFEIIYLWGTTDPLSTARLVLNDIPFCGLLTATQFFHFLV